MAKLAVARETVFALRREIARIERVLPERLETPVGASSAADTTIIRHGGIAVDRTLLRTGADSLDQALGGGLPKAALTEIHGTETRDAGSVTGFTLALLSLLLKAATADAPVLWIGTTEVFREAGFPYAGGPRAFFGMQPENLLFSETTKLVDALWIAEEASRLAALSAVIVEIRGNREGPDLTATRRLHRRAQIAGRPVFLLRQAGEAEPTAAPVRLVVSPAPAAPRATIAGSLAHSIGQPAFTVAIGKSRIALPGQFTLEWNSHERAFEERRSEKRRPKNPVPLVPASFGRADPAAASGTVLALQAAAAQAPRLQPPRQEHPAHRSPRRAG